MRGEYYQTRLAAERLKQVYETAPPRIRQYLQAEIDHVLRHVRPDYDVLELGCGYGRALAPLAARAGAAYGIDTSEASLHLAASASTKLAPLRLARMDAARLAFADRAFDLVVCLQNGISAFGIDHHRLLRESLRVTRPGGLILFSTYSERFWEPRLKWFEQQAEQGLLGPIDYAKTGHGRIVCTDGFTATTVTPRQFRDLARDLALTSDLVEIDHSSLFCHLYP